MYCILNENNLSQQEKCESTAAEQSTVSADNELNVEGCICLTPRALLIKMWLQNTMLFNISSGSGNHKLKWLDIKLRSAENVVYLE